MFKNYIWHSIPHYRNTKKNPDIYTLYSDYVIYTYLQKAMSQQTVDK